MVDKKNELERLSKRLKTIEPLITKTFKTSKELHTYREENDELYKEGKELFDKIQALEFDLMTPEEQAKTLAHLKLMDIKRRGKL